MGKVQFLCLKQKPRARVPGEEQISCSSTCLPICFRARCALTFVFGRVWAYVSSQTSPKGELVSVYKSLLYFVLYSVVELQLPTCDFILSLPFWLKCRYLSRLIQVWLLETLKWILRVDAGLSYWCKVSSRTTPKNNVRSVDVKQHCCFATYHCVKLLISGSGFDTLWVR